MEKESSDTIIVVISGPESTGKTELSRFLSEKTNMPWVPELSRGYIENLGRAYTYDDVENIARLQIEQFNEMVNQRHKVVFFDTDLIITKVWFDVVFQKCPVWVIEAIRQQNTRLHLLCNTDIPWIPDSVRENGGEMRLKLFEMYKNELHQFRIPYQIVTGIGHLREKNAFEILKSEGII